MVVLNVSSIIKIINNLTLATIISNSGSFIPGNSYKVNKRLINVPPHGPFISLKQGMEVGTVSCMILNGQRKLCDTNFYA